ncbi:MAG: hypothetical protein O3B73_14290 [bacterium]|jgi:flagellar basal body-associated protein FliL|nr:hypothetical protein [bacterium]
MIIAAFILIALAVLLFVFTPLFAKSDTLTQTSQRETKRRQMREEIERVYEALRELEFDRKMGKIEEEDYQDMHGRYQAQAVELMKALDNTNGRADHKHNIALSKESDDSIEQEIASIRRAKNRN